MKSNGGKTSQRKFFSFHYYLSCLLFWSPPRSFHSSESTSHNTNKLLNSFNNYSSLAHLQETTGPFPSRSLKMQTRGDHLLPL